jgi:hypothetical protein
VSSSRPTVMQALLTDGAVVPKARLLRAIYTPSPGATHGIKPETNAPVLGSPSCVSSFSASSSVMSVCFRLLPACGGRTVFASPTEVKFHGFAFNSVVNSAVVLRAGKRRTRHLAPRARGRGASRFGQGVPRRGREDVREYRICVVRGYSVVRCEHDDGRARCGIREGLPSPYNVQTGSDKYL